MELGEEVGLKIQDQVCEGNQVLGHPWQPALGCSAEESTDPKGPAGLNPYPRDP